MSLDPKTNTLAVTGGEDDKAFVWRLSDGELLFECSGEGLRPGTPTQTGPAALLGCICSSPADAPAELGS